MRALRSEAQQSAHSQLVIDNNEIFLAPNRAEAAHGSGQPLVSVYADYAGRCEVLRLLLLLLIEPTSQNIRGATKLFFSIAICQLVKAQKLHKVMKK